MKNVYVNAFINLIAEGADSTLLLKNLQTIMSARGHHSLYPKVLRALGRQFMVTSQRNQSTVIIASETDRKRWQSEVESALERLTHGESKPAIEYRIDPNCVGGYVVEVNGRRVDATYRTKLISLYHALTK